MPSQTLGLGGGGAMYYPVVSPHDANLMFVACDLTGLYRSENGGSTWRVVDGRQMQGNSQCSVAFDPRPTQAKLVYAYDDFPAYLGLRVSTNGGITWNPFLVPGPFGGLNGPPVTDIALDGTGRLFVGTTNGAYYIIPDSTGGWSGSTWKQCMDSGTTLALTGYVINFVFVTDPATGTAISFLATSGFGAPPTDGRVFLSFDQGQTWQDISAGLPSTFANGALRRINSLVGGTDVNSKRVVLYATVPSKAGANNTFEGGVFRYVKQGSSSGPWQSAMGSGINTIDQNHDVFAPCPDVAQYGWLGVATARPDTVYVAVCGTNALPATATAGVYRHSGVFQSNDGGANWRHIFFFIDNHKQPPMKQPTELNLEGGWVDWELDKGFSFGGPALIHDPISGDGNAGGFTVRPPIAIYASKSMLYIMNKPGSFIGFLISLFCRVVVDMFGDVIDIVCPPSPKLWQQAYTEPMVASQTGAHQFWSSIGLEVTTTWHYDIDPHDSQKHYICYTDIGFARSEDGGQTWQYNPPLKPSNDPQVVSGYNTVYEVAMDPDVAGRMWAAVADLHDIPSYQYLQDPTSLGGGGVMMSTDFGQSWTPQTGPLADPTVPDAPAVSIALDRNLQMGGRRLWVSIWGDGVYRSDNGGRTWLRKSTGLGNPTNKHIYRLHHHPDNTLNGKLFCSIAGKRQGDLFLGASGLWRSDDGGETWIPITADPTLTEPSRRTVDYAVHPTNPDIIYLCTAGVNAIAGGVQNKQAGAVYVTAMGTQLSPTWSKLNLPSTFPTPYDPNFFHAFAPFFDPANPNTIYVTTTYNGIWRIDASTMPPTIAEFAAIPFMSAHRLTFAGAAMYITTFGGGVWKVTPPPIPLPSWLRGVFSWWSQRPPVLVLTIAALGVVGALVARWRRRRAVRRIRR
jgi:hypothetical protein